MLDISTLEKFDSQGMFKVYDKWPDIAKKSYESEEIQIDLTDSTDHVIFSGMGGSGALGDIFSAILSKTKVHVCVVKGYHLPETVDSDTLVVATSISGDTVETLSVLEAAKQQDCRMIAFSSGGKMEKYCMKNRIQYRKIEQLHSPRASFTVFLYSMLKTLEPILPIRKNDIIESLEQLQIQKKNIGSHNLSSNNSAISLAEWINGIPLIYYPWGLQAAAIRFKNSLQENAKMHAMIEDVIEACHNNIVSWETTLNVQPILIEGYDDYYKTKERWKILKEFFDDIKIEYKEIHSVKGSILSKLINLIYLFDYTSIYRAILSQIDPTPVEAIDYIKKRII